MKKLIPILGFFTFIGISTLSTQTAHAQYFETPRSNTNFQFGLGFIPGVGAQVGYVKPFEIVTAEATAYLSFVPDTQESSSEVHLTAAFGGSIRFMRLIREFDTVGRGPNFDFDVGFRVGPKVDLRFDSSTDTDRVTIAVDPFVRAAADLRSGNSAYVEVGIVEPYVRLGMFIPIY